MLAAPGRAGTWAPDAAVLEQNAAIVITPRACVRACVQVSETVARVSVCWVCFWFGFVFVLSFWFLFFFVLLWLFLFFVLLGFPFFRLAESLQMTTARTRHDQERKKKNRGERPCASGPASEYCRALLPLLHLCIHEG